MPRNKSDSTKAKIADKRFGTRLRTIRTEKGISIQKLADTIGVYRNYISQLENGDRFPSFDTFINIVNALGVTADQLLIDYLNPEIKNGRRAELLATKMSALSPAQQTHIEEIVDLETKYFSNNK